LNQIAKKPMMPFHAISCFKICTEAEAVFKGIEKIAEIFKGIEGDGNKQNK